VKVDPPITIKRVVCFVTEVFPLRSSVRKKEVAQANFLYVPNQEFSQGFDQMGRGPQPFEPPGRGGVTDGRIETLGVDGTTTAFGVTVAVFFASSLMSASFDDETCAEALIPKLIDRTRANPKLREIDIYHTPAWMEHSLIYGYVVPAKGHIISYRQIYSRLLGIVKPITHSTLKDVDFVPHRTIFTNLAFLRSDRVLRRIKARLVCVKSKGWFTLMTYRVSDEFGAVGCMS